LFISVFVVFVAAFSFVKADDCVEIDPWMNIYSCEIWQECPAGAIVCACPDPYGDINTGFCWDPCPLIQETSNTYQCDYYQYCPVDGICACAWIIGANGACYPSVNPSSCSYSGKTINFWMSMQLYKTTTWACEQSTISCDDQWSTNLSNLNSSW
jgi:hypothetical protein